MPLKIVLEAPSVSADDAGTFATDAQSIFQAIGILRRGRRTHASRVKVVLADDFAGAVERYYVPRAGEVANAGWYVAERFGGRAAAKCLDQTSDASHVIVVFDSSSWRSSSSDALSRAKGFGALAHEFSHIVINRARYDSGVMEGVILPSVTGHEWARSLSRMLADEYRVDRIADYVVSACIQVSGGEAPDGLEWKVGRDDYLAAAAEVLATVHPGWADLVDEYRNWRIPMDEMWGRIQHAFEQVLTLLVHAQAHADAARAGEVFQMAELADRPAIHLYLGPLTDFLNEVRRWPVLMDRRHVVETETAITAAGERAMLAIWARLGLKPEDHGDRRWSLWVSEPAR